MDLPENIQDKLKNLDSNISETVHVDVIIDEQNINQEMQETVELVESIVAVVNKIVLHKIDINTPEAKKHNLNLKYTPAVIIYNEGKQSSFVYFGLPAEYELLSFIEMLSIVGSGQADLTDSNIEKIKSINTEKHIEMFVKSFCKDCPPMVIPAFKMSYLNPLIKVYVYEAQSFTEYAKTHRVMSVPKTIINGKTEIIEIAPIEEFIQNLIETV